MERQILKLIADNDALFDALKEMILEEFTDESNCSGDTISDIQLGQMFRARLVGRIKVEEAFKKIKRYKTPTEPIRSQRSGR